jgi:deoxyribonuclease V
MAFTGGAWMLTTKPLHSWDVTCREAVAIQQVLREKLILCDDEIPAPVCWIAGADISYSRGDDRFFGVVVMLSYPAMEMTEMSSFSARVSFPYVPGLLSFREGPILLKAFEKLKQRPDIALFDGQGIAHPRGIGLASHMGLFLDLPTIGCAKTKLVGSYGEVGAERGSFTDLYHGDSVIGAVVRTKSRVKPVFVSQGHRIGLKRAIEVVLACGKGYRLPEPVRQAHLAVNRFRAEAPARD